jgi:hypothetical protein
MVLMHNFGCFRPFWLEKFNALSGQFSALERELLNNRNLLKEFLLEPSAVPQNPTFTVDSIPNILLRSKLAPEVLEPIKTKMTAINNDDSKRDFRLFSNTIRALQDKFSIIQEDLQRMAAEHTSLLLANDIITSSGTATPKSSSSSEQDMDAILENSVRWLYTGQQ